MDGYVMIQLFEVYLRGARKEGEDASFGISKCTRKLPVFLLLNYMFQLYKISLIINL
ncbi:hypothetical protein Hanom_Chr01g00024971 [Helianthus anomalus]